MEELRILQRQFEDAATQFRGLYHEFGWTGEDSKICHVPESLLIPELYGTEEKKATYIKSWPVPDVGDAHISYEQYYDEIFDGEYTHWLLRPSWAEWSIRGAKQTLDVLATKTLKQIIENHDLIVSKKVGTSLCMGSLDDFLYLNEYGLDDTGRYLLALHVICNTEAKRIFGGVRTKTIGDGEPFCRVINDVFLESALLCQRLCEHRLQNSGVVSKADNTEPLAYKADGKILPTAGQFRKLGELFEKEGALYPNADYYFIIWPDPQREGYAALKKLPLYGRWKEKIKDERGHYDIGRIYAGSWLGASGDSVIPGFCYMHFFTRGRDVGTGRRQNWDVNNASGAFDRVALLVGDYLSKVNDPNIDLVKGNNSINGQLLNWGVERWAFFMREFSGRNDSLLELVKGVPAEAEETIIDDVFRQSASACDWIADRLETAKQAGDAEAGDGVTPDNQPKKSAETLRTNENDVAMATVPQSGLPEQKASEKVETKKQKKAEPSAILTMAHFQAGVRADVENWLKNYEIELSESYSMSKPHKDLTLLAAGINNIFKYAIAVITCGRDTVDDKAFMTFMLNETSRDECAKQLNAHFAKCQTFAQYWPFNSIPFLDKWDQNAYLLAKTINTNVADVILQAQELAKIDPLKYGTLMVRPQPDKRLLAWYEITKSKLEELFSSSCWNLSNILSEAARIRASIRNELEQAKANYDKAHPNGKNGRNDHKTLTKRKTLQGGSDKIEYSLPLPMTKWADILQMSENKLRELRDGNTTYHFDQVSARKWRLPKHEIPTEYLQKYKQAEKR